MTVAEVIRELQSLNSDTAVVLVDPYNHDGELSVFAVSGGLAGGVRISCDDPMTGDSWEELKELEAEVERLRKFEAWADAAYNTLCEQDGEWIDKLIETISE